jgi:hypothetical protein
MRSPFRLTLRTAVVLASLVLAAVLVSASGCRKPTREEPVPAPPAPAPEVRRIEPLALEDALLIAKDKMSEAGGQWVVESARRAEDGWTFQFVKTRGETGVGRRAAVHVEDNRRASMTPSA